MAKNTHAQEVSTGTSDSYTPDEWADVKARLGDRPQLGDVDTSDEKEEAPSVGNNSEASSENESQESDYETVNLPQDAPDVENPSGGSEVEGSTVHMTDGSSQETVAQPSGRPPRKAAKAAKAVPAPPRRRSPAGSEDDDF